MKKLRNHSQLNQQENSSKAVNSETDLCSLTDMGFKTEIVKILKELRANMKELRVDMNSNEIKLSLHIYIFPHPLFYYNMSI